MLKIFKKKGEFCRYTEFNPYTVNPFQVLRRVLTHPRPPLAIFLTNCPYSNSHTHLLPLPHFELSPFFSIVTTCFHVFTTSANCLQVSIHVPEPPHLISGPSVQFYTHFQPISNGLKMGFAYFWPFLIVSTCFFHHLQTLLHTHTHPQSFLLPTFHFRVLSIIFQHIFAYFHHFRSFLLF